VADLRTSLVAADYVDPAVYAAEVEHVLAGSWLPVCRADQITEPGDRFAITLCGRPVIATRTTDAGVRVIANVCAHRGSRLVDDGPGHDSTLVCPYHRWSYRPDGSFIGAPLADGADLNGVCLPELRSVEWQGFVLVNLSGNAPDPRAELRALDAHLAPWRWDELVTLDTRTFVSEWNWKVMVENWVECYHHLGTHRNTVEPFMPARQTDIIPNDGAPWVAMTVDTLEDAVADPARWIPGLTREHARELSIWAVFPLLLGGSSARHAFWLQVVPIDVTHHLVIWYLLGHRDHLAHFTRQAIAEDMDQFTVVHQEDMTICRAVQEGLASGFIKQSRLTPLEATISDFQRWVRSRG